MIFQLQRTHVAGRSHLSPQQWEWRPLSPRKSARVSRSKAWPAARGAHTSGGPEDEDGKACLIHSTDGNRTTAIAELSDDGLKPTGRVEKIFSGRFMEAPAVFKRRGKYYFIASGCTGWAPNAARSAVADSHHLSRRAAGDKKP